VFDVLSGWKNADAGAALFLNLQLTYTVGYVNTLHLPY